MKTILKEQRGHILLSMLVFMLSVNLIVAMLVVMASYALKIYVMNSHSSQSYWLARSEAVVMLHQFQAGSKVPTSQVLPVPDDDAGQIETTVAESTPGIFSVTVYVVSGESRHTVTFQYEIANHTVVDWQDSAVPPSGS